jgi:dTDP-4-dehydrorhamnose reductase
MDIPRWLITGANGFLGYRVGQQAARRGEAFGMIRSADRRVADAVAPVLGDLADPTSLSRVVTMVRPQFVIHMAAMTKVADCEDSPETSLQQNVVASREIAKTCRELGIHLVYASTDMVFDGESGNYAESSDARPLNVYGNHKLLAEQAIHDVCPMATICRLPWMFGVPTPSYDGHFGGMVRSFLADESVTLFEDEFRTPLGTEQVATAILDISLAMTSAQDFSGDLAVPRVLHIAGPLTASRFEIGCWAAEGLGASNDRVVRASRADGASVAKRPANTSLVSEFPDHLGDIPKRDIKADIVSCALRIKHEIECPSPGDHSHTGHHQN